MPGLVPGIHVHPRDGPAQTNPEHLVRKVEAGVDFLITQLFFDNDDYFSFVARARDAGIRVPIVPGILPVTNFKQVARFSAGCAWSDYDRDGDLDYVAGMDGGGGHTRTDRGAILVLAGTANAVNFTDGLDGLAIAADHDRQAGLSGPHVAAGNRCIEQFAIHFFQPGREFLSRFRTDGAHIDDYFPCA